MAPEAPPATVRGLYSATMLAEAIGAPAIAVRRWHRRGYLVARHEVRRLAYFDVAEIHAARLLAELMGIGCSLAMIDCRIDELVRLFPHVARPLFELPLVVEGRRLLVRYGDDLAEPCGQLLFDFDSHSETDAGDEAASVATLSMRISGDEITEAGDACSVDQLRDRAAEFESTGEVEKAIEVLRSLIVCGGGSAEDHFLLGDLLYRQGDLPAARERFYSAIELDENYIEARANLGCVLAELGDHELAEAALRGALSCHAEYADAQYHLARLLDRMGRSAEANQHWREFAALAPESPWVAEARDRLTPAR